MQVSCEALDEWKSLYTEEMQSIWNTERQELRRVAILLHVLKREFAQIESNLSHEMDIFRQKVETINNLNISGLSTSPEPPSEKPLQQTRLNNVEESQLSKSPKLNRYRKSSHLKKPVNSQSLLGIPKESKNTKNIIANSTPQRTKSEELFNSYICDGPVDADIFEDSMVDHISNKSVKTPHGIKRLANVDVVESSFIVEDTPNKSDKKCKWTRKHTSLKGTQSKRPKTKEKKSFTLTQMFDNFPNQKIKVNTTNGDKGKNAKQFTTLENKLEQGNLDDETFFAVELENHENINKNMPPERKIPFPDACSKDYDKIPVPKSTTPQHAHKTETVRRKADRMKLPGWSCSECEQYYKGFNFSPEGLRKKMNMCSKHRNKFPLLDTTPKGYWDVAMPVTQEQIDNTLFQS